MASKITNLEDLINNNDACDNDDIELDTDYEGEINLESSITRKLSVDYEEDDDGYFARKIDESEPGKLPQTREEKQDADDENAIIRRKSLHNTNLVLACTRGQIEKVRMYLNHEDASINFVEEINMFSPLHACVINGHYKVLKLLLKQENVDTEIYDRVGWTPIMYAARHNEVSQIMHCVTNVVCSCFPLNT
jgi:ankyrin repeat protein